MRGGAGLDVRNAKKLLKDAVIWMDAFDNAESRKILKTWSLETGVACLHVRLNTDYADVIWNETYRIPSAAGQDVCDYSLARNLILIAVSVAAESLIRFITRGEKRNYTITLGDFAIREYITK